MSTDLILDRREAMHRLGLCCGGLAGMGLLGACQSTNVAPLSPEQRPAADTDEAGLWLQMDKVEREIAVSPNRLRDAALEEYLREVACKVASPHCGNLRIYVMRRPYFNASMAPNGMMLIWSGALLRMENEAQLAALVGHESGHFIERHVLETYRRLKNNADAAMVFGVVVPVLPVLVAISDYMAFSREQERHADSLGLEALAGAGYDPSEMARIWENAIAERDADPNKKEKRDPFLSTHPEAEERLATITERAKALKQPGQRVDAEGYLARIRPLRDMLLEDELQLRRPERTLNVLGRLSKTEPAAADLRHYTGEVYRLRNAEGDEARARTEYNAAISINPGYPRSWRGLGMLERAHGKGEPARSAFRRYLELYPEAPDAAFLQNYIAQTS